MGGRIVDEVDVNFVHRDWGLVESVEVDGDGGSLVAGWVGAGRGALDAVARDSPTLVVGAAEDRRVPAERLHRRLGIDERDTERVKVDRSRVDLSVVE